MIGGSGRQVPMIGDQVPAIWGSGARYRGFRCRIEGGAHCGLGPACGGAAAVGPPPRRGAHSPTAHLNLSRSWPQHPHQMSTSKLNLRLFCQ